MKRLAQRHLQRLRACFAELPDPMPRRGRNRRYAMADVAMAALSVFFMQSPSFLAHQRALAEAHTRSNAHTLFGLSRIPCDNHIRQLLDAVLRFAGCAEVGRAAGTKATRSTRRAVVPGVQTRVVKRAGHSEPVSSVDAAGGRGVGTVGKGGDDLDPSGA